MNRIIPAAIVIAALAAGPATAKVVVLEKNDNDRVVDTLSVPKPSPKKPAAAKQPSKAELKKSKIAPKPPLHDPD